MSLTLVAAISKNNCIGHAGSVPWNIPEDIKHMKEATIGKVVLMGRKTWESIPKKYRPLPKRQNVVVTRQLNYQVPPGVEVYNNVDDALAAHQGEDVVSFGGGEIYHQTIAKADFLNITHVNRTVNGDSFFPKIDPKRWTEKSREDHDGFSFVMYKRVRNYE